MSGLGLSVYTSGFGFIGFWDLGESESQPARASSQPARARVSPASQPASQPAGKYQTWPDLITWRLPRRED